MSVVPVVAGTHAIEQSSRALTRRLISGVEAVEKPLSDRPCVRREADLWFWVTGPCGSTFVDFHPTVIEAGVFSDAMRRMGPDFRALDCLRGDFAIKL